MTQENPPESNDTYIPSWANDDNKNDQEVDFEALAQEKVEEEKREGTRILKRNKTLSYVIALTHQVGFLTPIWVIFGTDHLDLSLTLALILGSTAWVSSALFEVPMGAFADRFGRQLSVVLGLGLCAVGDLALVMFDNFALLMVFQTFAGVGFALRSGSFEGLLHDTYESQGDLTSYSKLSSQLLFLLNASRILTVPIGAWLYELKPEAKLSSFTYPYIANIACYCVALYCAGLLIERRSEAAYVENYRTGKHKGIAWILYGHAASTFKAMLANKDITRVVILLGLYALIGEGNWALYQAYFRDRDIPLSGSGWVYTVLVLCMTLGSRYVQVIYKRINVMWAMIFIIALVTFDVFLMQLAIPFAIVGFIASAFVGPMSLYLYDNAIQNRMTGNHKSSALSIASMTYTIGAMIGVFGVGAIADEIGVLDAQKIFIVYGAIVIVIMGLWCMKDGLAVRPEDARATIDVDQDGIPDSVVNPIDDPKQLKP